MKYIAIDSRAFSELIRGGYIYVDKTKYIYELVKKGSPSKFWFLSRPRRFGKSLTIDTLYNLFKGNKELFEGTYIYDKYDFESFPVIRLNMSIINGHTPELISSQIMKMIELAAMELEVQDLLDTSLQTPSNYLYSLILAVRLRYGKSMAILVDEYDYPLMENMHNDSFEEVQSELANFYNIFKAAVDDIHFCFLSGVTRFPHVSIFSKLNNLTDISNDPNFSALCGYTDDEVDRYFAPYMKKYFEESDIKSDEEKKAFRKNIKDYYNGYCFSDDVKTTVYNPVSLGSFFNGGCVFKNYWIGTGSQSIVNEVVRNNPKLFSSDNKIEIGKSSLSSFEVKNLLGKNASPNAIYSYLVQAGYMTIKGVDGGRYVLSYPNLEVKDAMETSILENSYGLDIYSDDFSELRKLFASGDTASIINIFQKFFISFPYDMSLEKERGYQIAFSAVLKAIGFEYIEMEEKTNIGRIDISLEVNEKLYYIIELKLDGSAEEALKQIKEKKYHEKYSRKGNVIHLLGINFSSKERNITDWKEEIVVC